MIDRDVTMLLAGDLAVQRADPESIFEHSAAYLREADVFFGNLEWAVTDRGRPTEAKGNGARIVKSDERNFPAYVLAGLDAVGLANNHSMNYGEEGLLRTIELLEQAGIAHAGGGKDIEQAREPAMLDRKGNQIAFLSYSSVFVRPFAARADRGGIATVRVATAFESQPRADEVPGSPPIIHTIPSPADAALMAADVRKARERADAVIVSWHWGVSAATGDPGKLLTYQEEMAHAAVDAGADVVIGHHPHELQAIEVYKGKPIFYSLGNFAFDLHDGRSQTTALARCLISDGAVREVSYVPVLINERAQPRVVDTQTGAGIVERVAGMSSRFGTLFDVRPQDVLIRLDETGPRAGTAAGRR
jgi:poly-gamma-glutamate capsule biosynthesis protein CapA/YwtB (metallophosphatase superfamily)